VYGGLLLIGKPAPLLVRALAILVVIAGALGGATVASGDSLPDDALYSFKLAGEQLRLAIAINPEDRAAVELSMADHRLDEAERLATSGRGDDAIIATASYGSSLADAAADLASVELTDPRTAALVTQVQTSLIANQERVAATVARLAADPRTAEMAEVLATVAATSSTTRDSPATRIAAHAVAITARLATVADHRARLADPRRTEAPRASLTPRTDPPVTTRGAVAGTTTLTVRQSASERPTTSPTASPTRPATATPAARLAQTLPANASAARQAAEIAMEAAQRALMAAEKAKRAEMQSPGPTSAPAFTDDTE
jgi:hypothetical protein